MTCSEIFDELKSIASKTGPKGEAYISMSTREQQYQVSASCYPEGITGGKHAIYGYGCDFETALAELREKVAGQLALIHANRIREMALAIMETAFDTGECSDAALRGQGFSQNEIDTLGENALERANAIADGGPYEIVKAASNYADAAE